MNSKQAHPFTSLSLSITMTTNSRALPRPALQRRPELRARGADAVGQLVQSGGAGVWVRRQRGRKGWGQKRDFFFSFSLKKKKKPTTTTTTTITISPQKRPGPLHRGQPRVLDLSQPRGGLFPGGRRRRRVRAGVRSPAAAAQALGAAVLLVRGRDWLFFRFLRVGALSSSLVTLFVRLHTAFSEPARCFFSS